MRSPLRHPDSQRGSLLIVALLLSVIIGIALVSYIRLARTALNVSNRSLYNNAAMNLAEQGLEEAMYSVNQSVADSSYDWVAASWTADGGANVRRKWTSVSLSQNTTGEYRVYVYNNTGVVAAPKIVTRAIVTLGGTSAAPIEKWIEVQLAKTSLFASGLVAKTSIVFNGNNATVDSWNSEKNDDGTPRGSPVPFSNAVRRDNGTVGSISISSDAVLTKNADVWGYVSNNSGLSGTDPGDFVSTNGSILGADSTPDATWEHSNVDPERVQTTFSAPFDAVKTPDYSAIANLGNIDNDLTLPRAADVGASLAAGASAGEYEGYYFYDASKIDLVNKKLTISGKVVLRLASTATTVNTGGGSGEISIGSAGMLAVYAPGTVKIAGQGISNGVDADSPADGIQQDEMGQPKQFRLYGTQPSGEQSITVAGNGLFSGVIYAPQGAVKITGNGAVSGSVVANKITLDGNAQFHYDESLKDLGGDSPYRVSKWKELTTATSRSTYSTALTW
jgi:Tfp pilus assembly protein PilX